MNELNLIQEGSGVPVYEDWLHFDSAYNEWVQMPFNFLTGTRTVSFRVKPDVTTFNGQARQFLAAQYASSNQRSFYIEFRDTGVIRLYISTSTFGNSYAIIESNAGQYFNAGQSYYITYTIEPSGGSKLYVDGVLQTNTHPNTLPISRSGAYFTVGGGSLAPTLASDSKIKDVNVWTIARSQSDILDDMTRTWTGSESGLKGYFAFNEGSGNTVQDINSVYSGSIITLNTTPNYINDFMWVKDQSGTTSGSREKVQIDLFENQFVSVTKQSFDINNLGKRLSGVTNNFNLPLTAKNSETFDYLDLNGNLSNKPYQINYVEYIQDGTPIIKKGRLNVKEISESGYKVDVTHGINDFFDRIRDKYLYKPFDERIFPLYGGIAINSSSWYNYAGNAPIGATQGIIMPVSNFSGTSPFYEYQQSPFIKIDTSLDFICEDAGYTFVDNTGGKLDSKCFGGGKLFEYKAEQSDVTYLSRLFGIVSVPVKTYFTEKKGVLLWSYSMRWDLISPPGCSINVLTYIDGVLSPIVYSSSPLTGVYTDYFFGDTGTTIYPRGTKIEVVLEITGDPSADIEFSFGDYGYPKSSMVGVKESGIAFFENIFKDLTQVEYVSYLCKLFNLGLEVNPLSKELTMYSLNDVYNPTIGNTIDFSEYFSNVISKKFDSSFGKTNRFTYKYLDERSEVYNGLVKANNTNKEKNLIESEITASFHDLYLDMLSFGRFILTENGYDGNTLEDGSKDIGFRILNYENLDGLNSSLSFDFIDYAGSVQSATGYASVTNFDGLDWSSLIEDNYSSLRDNVLNRYSEVKVLMRVPRHLIDLFSFQNKIFIEQLNSKFVVQSIKTRPDGLSEWVLIKLN